MGVLVEADRLRKTFGSITAVDEISLTVSRGEVLGFLGPNGAGKSTTMKMLTGFLEPDGGSARICGIAMAERPKDAKSCIGYLPEGAPAYGEMTPRSFLGFVAEMRGYSGDSRGARVHAAIMRTGLQDVIDQRIETLSKGFKRRVGIAQAILHDPPVLIMDEPTDGLDPNQKHHVRRLIAEMSRDKAIIVSTHILEEVEAVCTRAVIIDKGRIVADGTADDLQRRLDYHNSVAIRVDEAVTSDVVAALEGFTNVQRIDRRAVGEGQVLLHAIAREGTAIAGEVTARLSERRIAIHEVYVERGKLDDVFRQITSQEGRGTHA